MPVGGVVGPPTIQGAESQLKGARGLWAPPLCLNCQGETQPRSSTVLVLTPPWERRSGAHHTSLWKASRLVHLLGPKDLAIREPTPWSTAEAVARPVGLLVGSPREEGRKGKGPKPLRAAPARGLGQGSPLQAAFSGGRKRRAFLWRCRTAAALKAVHGHGLPDPPLHATAQKATLPSKRKPLCGQKGRGREPSARPA